MAETYIYDASTHLTKVRDQTVELTEVADGGAVGTSNLVIEDPSGNTTITGHKTFRVHQSNCSVINVFRGFVADRDYLRGDAERTTTARQISLQLIDLNAKLGFKVIRGAAWRKRPRHETIGERLTDMLAASFCNGIHDNGFVQYPDTELDGREDLRGQFPGDVIGDMAERVGYNWFIYWDEAAGQASLWFQNSNTSTDWSSTLRISDVASDVDSTTTFAPSFDTKLSRSPGRTVSGVWLPYSKGNVYRTRAETEDNYEPRDGTAPNANVKRRRRARNLADRYLSTHSTEEDTITTTMRQVPDTKVNLIRAGQRIEAKFTSFTNEGYGDFTWFRVKERTVKPLVAEASIYDIDLVLAPQEEGGGSCEVTIVQSKAVETPGETDITFDNPTSAGNLLVAIGALRGTDATVPAMFTAGFTLQESVAYAADTTPGNGGAEAVCFLFTKTAADGDTVFARWPHTELYQWRMYELSGATTSNMEILSATRQNPAATSLSLDLGTFTDATGVALIVEAETRGNAGAALDNTFTFPSPWTERYNEGLDTGLDQFPRMAIADATVEDVDLDAALTFTESEPGQSIGEWAGIAVMFSGDCG